MKLRTTITFQPDPDVLAKLAEVDKRGKGVRTRVINQALREQWDAVLKRWDAFAGGPQSSASSTH